MSAVRPATLCLLALGCVTAASCAREIDHAGGGGDGDASKQGGGRAMDGGMDGGSNPFGNSSSDPDMQLPMVDRTGLKPLGMGDPAFFINDPPPPYCGPAGMEPDYSSITGSRDCPSDKNRQGCPCPKAGEEAPCWPGERVNRNHGICKDGMTQCVDTPEFGLLWDVCDGYVLPKEDALAGPEACGCFSAGTWELTNLAPCIYKGALGTYLYSSTIAPDGSIDCGSNVPDPPPLPGVDWSESTLNVDCAGTFTLCYTIRAGDVANPSPSDCVVMQTCIEDVYYPKAGEDLALPVLPSWVSGAAEVSCADQFEATGGYGEMSVVGKSNECDVVDDGKGNPYVFHRTDYCPPSCQEPDRKDDADCKACQTGGSGMFN